MIEGIVITVVGGLILAVILWLWNRRRAPRRWLQEQNQTELATERQDAAQELTVLREQVLEVARARKVVIPAASKGISPTVVTFSDGTTRFYFNDHARYKHAMQARQVPPTRSFPGKPPVPVSRWTREAIEQWLAENAD